MKFTKKTVYEVDSADLDHAVTEFYGVQYSVVCALETGNDTDHTVHVDGSELGYWATDMLKGWKESGLEGHSPRPSTVLNPMARAGVIPEGEYLISVCW